MITSVFSFLLAYEVFTGYFLYQWHFSSENQNFEQNLDSNIVLRNNFIKEVGLVLIYILGVVSVIMLILDLNLIIFHLWLINEGKTTFDFLTERWE